MFLFNRNKTNITQNHLRKEMKQLEEEKQQLEEEKKQLEKEKQQLEEKKKLDESANDKIINLMNIYQEEWFHRDTSFWSHAFKFFYSSLLVTLLPRIAEVVHQNALDKIGINKKLYPIAGLIIAIFFILMALQDARRAKAAYKSYDRVMRTLPKDWQRMTLRELSKHFGCFYDIRLGLIACLFMFAGLVALSIVSLVFR